MMQVKNNHPNNGLSGILFACSILAWSVNPPSFPYDNQCELDLSPHPAQSLGRTHGWHLLGELPHLGLGVHIRFEAKKKVNVPTLHLQGWKRIAFDGI